MAVFTSGVSGRRALEQVLADVLNLEQDGRTREGRRPREGLARARLELGDASAFSAEALRHYRSRGGLPDGLVQGAALALFGDSSLTRFRPDELEKADPALAEAQIREAIEIENALVAELVGLQFESTLYECTVKPGPGDMLDATIVQEHRFPRVSRRFGSLPFSNKSATEFLGGDSVDPRSLASSELNKVEVSGAGVTWHGTRVALTTESKMGQILPSGAWRPEDPPVRRMIEMTNEFTIGPDTTADTVIRITREVKRAFSLVPSPHFHLDYAGMRIGRPTKTLTITLNLPEDMFHDRNSAVVSAFAWLQSSPGIEGFNARISRQLVGTEPRMVGPHKWVWKSNGPVLRGVVYALGYDTRQTAYFKARGQESGAAARADIRRAKGRRKPSRSGE